MMKAKLLENGREPCKNKLTALLKRMSAAKKQAKAESEAPAKNMLRCFLRYAYNMAWATPKKTKTGFGQ